jgi:hypothetical protein
MSVTQLVKRQVSQVLENAADHVAEFGWSNNGENYKHGTPMCVYLTAADALDRSGYQNGGYYGTDLNYAMVNALLASAGVNSQAGLMERNDSITDKAEGQAWAIDVLLGAANLARGVPIDTPRRIDPNEFAQEPKNLISRLGRVITNLKKRWSK